MAETILEAHQLNRSFGGLQAVDNVSFSVITGQIKAVIGPNGAGKSTLFNLIAGTLPPDNGHVLFRSHKITGLREDQVATRGIARTFQTTKLFHHLTVLENVMAGRHSKTNAGFLSALLNLPHTWREEAATRDRALEILESIGLADSADELSGNLAFGKQRLLEIARALAAEPQLLLLDEPAAGLNIYETEELATLIRQIRELGITVLIVEHDISLVMDISDTILVLDRGKRIAEGKPLEIQHNPLVIKVYLGEDDA